MCEQIPHIMSTQLCHAVNADGQAKTTCLTQKCQLCADNPARRTRES